jgi:hypothetical protein
MIALIGCLHRHRRRSAARPGADQRRRHPDADGLRDEAAARGRADPAGAVYIGCEYGGRISSILLNVPGDAGAVMTTLDGYPMAKQGPRRRGAVDVGAGAPSPARWSPPSASCSSRRCWPSWALSFGPAEYFALMCFACRCIGGLIGDAAERR